MDAYGETRRANGGENVTLRCEICRGTEDVRTITIAPGRGHTPPERVTLCGPCRAKYHGTPDGEPGEIPDEPGEN